MRFSVLSLVLLIFLAAIFFAGWSEPNAVWAQVCLGSFAVASMTALILSIRGRAERKWFARGFALSGLALLLVLHFGEPVHFSDMIVDRLVANHSGNARAAIVRRQAELHYIANGDKAEYERVYGRPYAAKMLRWVKKGIAPEQARLEVLHAALLFSVSLVGGAASLLCRSRQSYATYLYFVAIFAVTIFNVFCLLQGRLLWREAAITATTTTFVLSLVAIVASRGVLRAAAIAFIVVGGAYFLCSLAGEPDYLSAGPKNRFVSRLYQEFVPKQNQPAIGAIFQDGVSVSALILNPEGLFEVEFAEILHCFIATSSGCCAALMTSFLILLSQKVRSAAGALA